MAVEVRAGDGFGVFDMDSDHLPVINSLQYAHLCRTTVVVVCAGRYECGGLQVVLFGWFLFGSFALPWKWSDIVQASWVTQGKGGRRYYRRGQRIYSFSLLFGVLFVFFVYFVCARWRVWLAQCTKLVT